VDRGQAAGWLVDPTEVRRGEELGAGSFGTTYKGSWRGADVAVKCVRVSSAQELNSFLQEVETLSQVGGCVCVGGGGLGRGWGRVGQAQA
jgi:serine/threonine-protein kinase TNNI3K